MIDSSCKELNSVYKKFGIKAFESYYSALNTFDEDIVEIGVDDSYKLSKNNRTIIINPDENSPAKLLILSQKFDINRDVYGSQKQFRSERAKLEIELQIVIPESGTDGENFKELKKIGFSAPWISQGDCLYIHERNSIFPSNPNLQNSLNKLLHGGVPVLVISKIADGPTQNFFSVNQYQKEDFDKAMDVIANNAQFFGKDALDISKILKYRIFEKPSPNIEKFDDKQSFKNKKTLGTPSK